MKLKLTSLPFFNTGISWNIFTDPMIWKTRPTISSSEGSSQDLWKAWFNVGSIEEKFQAYTCSELFGTAVQGVYCTSTGLLGSFPHECCKLYKGQPCPYPLGYQYQCHPSVTWQLSFKYLEMRIILLVQVFSFPSYTSLIFINSASYGMFPSSANVH